MKDTRLPALPAGDQREGEEQEMTLAEINDILRSRGLKTLATLGARENGRWRFTHIVGIGGNPWYSIVQFGVIRPDGKKGLYFIKFNAKGLTNKSVGFIATLGDYIVLVRQERPPMFNEADPHLHWTEELPRAGSALTGEASVGARRMKQGPCPFDGDLIEVVGRELAPLVLSGMVRLDSASLLGCVPEDTGASSVWLDYYHLKFTLLDGCSLEQVMAKARGPREMRLKFYTLAEVMANLRPHNGGSHTHSAILLFLSHYGRIDVTSPLP